MANKHILISYQWDHQDRAIKIRDKLQQAGYRVWIDVNMMEDNLLNAMAKGVDEAGAILMCISSKYKASANCQAEANYAFKLKKPIIPVKVEKDYEADGWLGIVIGTSLYFNAYSDDVMEKTWPQLLRQLESVAKKN
ncbi:uncharacterized protein [Amphiura filiformis]|uniref:uncharacterized protein n=1 Tax=Amphiura filiformis TaxID=82378 RepID=UPI003B21E6B1